MRRLLMAGMALLIGTTALVGVAVAGAGWTGHTGMAPPTPQLRAWLTQRDRTGVANHDSKDAPIGGGSFFRDPIAPTVAVGGGPVAVAVATATDTVYVGNGNDGTVSVVNGAICNATVTSGCGQSAPSVAVGPGPVDAVVDQSTNTVYVASVGGNTVSVIDGNSCNAQHTSGCVATPARITVGNAPDGLALDRARHTLYVANGADNTVSVVDTSTCNAGESSGCNQTPAAIAVGGGPAVPAMNGATDTLYVPNSADRTISVVNGASCNAENTSGCSQTAPTLSVGPNPFQAIVDQATDTVYEIAAPGGPNTNLGSVYVINGASCNALVMSGCGQVAPQVTVGSIPIGLVQDSATKNIFVLNEEDSSVSVIDGSSCNASHTSGCGKAALTVSVGHNPGFLDVNAATHTLYVSNQNDNTVSVLDAAACTAQHQAGCRIAAPTTTVGTAPQGIAADPATNTVYVGNRTDGNLSVIDASRCNAKNGSSCRHAWPTVATGDGPQALAVNQLTDTVYTANVGVEFSGGNTVSVVDGSTCNAKLTTGCSKTPATVTVGDNPIALAVDQATNTIYVANAGADFNGDTVSVINGATCSGANHAGCSAPVATITVGHHPASIAVDEATDTIYVVNANDRTVSVIDGATCNGTNQSGCSQTPPTTSATGSPSYVAVEQATNTVYLANFFMTISVIDGNACNAHDPLGCAPIATMTSPDFITSMTIEQYTGAVFVDRSFYGSQVWAFDGSRCNAQATSGCTQTPAAVPVGGWPGDLATDPNTHTVYVPDNVDGEVSLFGYDRGVAFP